MSPANCRVVVEVRRPVVASAKHAHTRIVALRTPPDSPTSTPWLAWRPSGRDTLTWTESYGLYAAAAPAHRSAPLHLLAERYAALPGIIYEFDGKSFRESAADDAVLPARYYVRNGARAGVVFGLVQRPMLNAMALTAPVNVVALAHGSHTDFVPSRSLYLRLDQDGDCVGTTALTFDGERTSYRVRFDGATSQFVQIPDEE